MSSSPPPPPPPAPPDGGSATDASDGDGSYMDMVPQELAIELLHSKNAKIAAAAARVFSSPPQNSSADSPMIPSAGASRSSPPLLDIGSTSHPKSSDELPTGFAKSTAPRGAAPVSNASNSAAGTTESSTAASALTAMAATTANATLVTSSEGVHAAATGGSSRLPAKKFSSSERLQRSRERNRMHARKTRQRKKEHMSALQERCEKLKNEQLRLKQAINEKNTASILLGMFGSSELPVADGCSADTDPKVDELMKRSTEDIPDASKIPELPALILPGQHSSKKIREAASVATGSTGSSADESESSSIVAPLHSAVNAQGLLPDDGIDYDLLSKDRSKCTPAELDQIRRERNRMHAKRTRDRKRIFMEEMEVMIKQLEDENRLLDDHLAALNDKMPGSSPTSSSTTPSLGPSSPALKPNSDPAMLPPPVVEDQNIDRTRSLSNDTTSSSGSHKKRPLMPTAGPKQSPTPSVDSNSSGITVDQIKTILSTAGELDKNSAIAGMLTISSVASAVSAQNSDDEGETSDRVQPPSKRRCIIASSAPVSASC